MKFDIKQALLAYDLKTGAYLSANFAQFSPAYVVTNEDVREAVRILEPQPGAKILTVAGSGDQALFYKLAGASHVDTFDITFNAKMIMDIKTSAIQCLSANEYISLLNQMRHSRDVSKIPQYQMVQDYMPVDSKEYIYQMRGAHLTRGGSYLDNVLYKNEYEKAQQLIKEPFNFIWTDLTDLASHLTQKYDQIYLSNILQYNTKPEYVVKVITNLMDKLASGGKILVNIAPWFDGDELFAIKELQKKVTQMQVASVAMIKTHEHSMCVLKKR